MLFEEPSTRELLSRIVHRVGRNPSWHDDLMQEAIIHLWRVESREPGHTLSWYLQSCHFHLKNRLAAGRSADSAKRQHRLDFFCADSESSPFEMAGEDSIHSEVMGREIALMLQNALNPLDQTILAHLAEGFGCREIARKLGISHPAVVKHRRGIAALAIRLGIAPLRDLGHSLDDNFMNGSGWATRQRISRRAVATSARLGRPKAATPKRSARNNGNPTESKSFLQVELKVNCQIPRPLNANLTGQEEEKFGL